MAFEVTYRETQEFLVTYVVEADDSFQAELEAYEAGELIKSEQTDLKCEVVSVFPAKSAEPQGMRMWAAYVYNPNAESGTPQRNHRLFLLPADISPDQLHVDALVSQLGLEVVEGCDLDLIAVNEDPVCVQF